MDCTVLSLSVVLRTVSMFFWQSISTSIISPLANGNEAVRAIEGIEAKRECEREEGVAHM